MRRFQLIASVVGILLVLGVVACSGSPEAPEEAAPASPSEAADDAATVSQDDFESGQPAGDVNAGTGAEESEEDEPEDEENESGG